jgi:serine protease Do
MIRLEDGRTFRAELIARDPQLDLAILRIPVRALESAQRRHSLLRTAELVVAVGHPLGEAGAVSLGIVHATPGGHMIEADIRLLPGNSGGPLADASGRVAGINCMVANGMAVAISTAAIERFLQKHVTTKEGTG